MYSIKCCVNIEGLLKATGSNILRWKSGNILEMVEDCNINMNRIFNRISVQKMLSDRLKVRGSSNKIFFGDLQCLSRSFTYCKLFCMQLLYTCAAVDTSVDKEHHSISWFLIQYLTHELFTIARFLE